MDLAADSWRDKELEFNESGVCFCERLPFKRRIHVFNCPFQSLMRLLDRLSHGIDTQLVAAHGPCVPLLADFFKLIAHGFELLPRFVALAFQLTGEAGFDIPFAMM